MSRTGPRLSRKEVAALPTGSSAEILLSAQLEQAGIPFEREVKMLPDRRYRADFLVGSPGQTDWYDWGLIIEVEGGVWSAGRHTRGKGFESDTEKQALAMIHGYRYLRVTTAQVEDGRALSWIRQLIEEAA